LLVLAKDNQVTTQRCSRPVLARHARRARTGGKARALEKN